MGGSSVLGYVIMRLGGSAGEQVRTAVHCGTCYCFPREPLGSDTRSRRVGCESHHVAMGSGGGAQASPFSSHEPIYCLYSYSQNSELRTYIYGRRQLLHKVSQQI